MNSIIKDLKFALRGLLKHPAFTAIAVVTLALGIGGRTSIFTVVNAALLRGLPYKSPDRLYHIWEQTPKQEFPKREFSYPDYQDYQQNNVFDGLAGYTGGGASGSDRTYDVTRDGQRFLMIKMETEPTATARSIVVVINWFEELKRAVP